MSNSTTSSAPPEALIATALYTITHDPDDSAARQAAAVDCGRWNGARDALWQERQNGGVQAAQALLRTLMGADRALLALLARHTPQNGQPADPFGGEPPIPLDDLALPEFPVEALPEPLATFTSEACVSLQVQPDVIGLLTLGVASLCLSKRIEVAVKTDWTVPVNLWAIIVLPSGSRKTAAVSLVIEPVKQWEAAELLRVKPDIERKRAERRLMEEQAEALRRKAAKEPGNAALQAEAVDAAVRASAIVVPAEPCLHLTDATPEALIRAIADQNGRIGVIASEPRLIEAIQQYNGAGESIPFATLLELYGDGAIRRVRITSSSIVLERPALTLIVAVQPHILTGLMRDAAFVHSGFTGRAIWCIPRTNIGFRAIDPPAMTKATRDAWGDLVQRMLAIPPASPDKPERAVSFAPDARRAFLAFADDIERRQRPGGDLETLAPWASKLAGTAARLAGVIHGVKRAAEGADPLALIDLDSVQRAITIAQYAIPHAIAAHDQIAGVRGDPRTERLLAWIAQQPGDQFNARAAFNALRSSFRTMSALEPVLALLEQHNYIVQVQARQGRGRPARVYAINRNPARYRV